MDTSEVDKQIRDENGMLTLVPDFQKASEPFYIRHKTSNLFVHPRKGQSNPKDAMYISLFNTYPTWARFRYIPLKDEQGYGLIQHFDSGKFLHPLGGSATPVQGTTVVIHSGYHYACVFTFLQESKTVHHIAGLNWYPKSGKPNAGNYDPIVLRKGKTTANSFMAVYRN